MANNPIVPPESIGPTTEDAFIADRQTFWSYFTRFVVVCAAGIVVLLILMAIFLV